MDREQVNTPLLILPVGDGIIIPLNVANDQEEQLRSSLNKGVPTYKLKQHGMTLTIGDIIVPLSTVIMEHLITTGVTVYFYAAKKDGYFCDFLGSKSLDRDRVLRLLGAWETRHVEDVSTADLN